MLSQYLEKAINHSFSVAFKSHCEFLTLEHFLLGLLEDASIEALITHLGGDTKQLKEKLYSYLDDRCPHIQDNRSPQPTASFQRIIQRSVSTVQAAGKDTVTCLHALISIINEQDSYASYYLRLNNISQLDLMSYSGVGNEEDLFTSISIKNPSSDEALDMLSNPYLINKNMDEFEEKRSRYSSNDVNSDDESELSKINPLEEFTINLNKKAEDGLIDPLVGREEIIMRIIQTLARRRKNNPILVGEPGVGKTAIAEGLASAIVNKKDFVPNLLRDCCVYSLNVTALVAGTRYRGDIEDNVHSLINELNKDKNIILFIDNIHTIIGAGASADSDLDISNMLKPALADGQIRCIGATTDKAYRRVFDQDNSIARLFQKINVEEPSLDEAELILHRLSNIYEDFHLVKFEDKVVETAVKLSDRYINDRRLPDKAIDLIDEASARLRIEKSFTTENSSSQSQEQAKEEDLPLLTSEYIEKLVAEIAHVPQETVSTQDKDKLKNLEKNLSARVFGQDEAIKELSETIKLSRAGLRDKEKTIGSFLFTGPTGVGKTELCRALADLLSIKLLRFDMSEYMEQHSVSKLIGSPPGYVGYEKGGLLSEKISNNPHAVLLLDEVEKAHPDINNILLQIMDYGMFTDANGRNINCRNLIVIMTSNVGAFEMDKNSIGFTNQDDSSNKSKRDAAIKQRFTPEFRNRLDAIINFSALTKENIGSIVDKFIDQLQQHLQEKQCQIKLSEKAKQWFCDNGYDQKMGARPMGRLIQKHIKQKLADALLFGELHDGGGNILVDLNPNGNIELKITKNKKITEKLDDKTNHQFDENIHLCPF